MKRFAVVLALVALTAFVVGELGDLTQSRPDEVRADATTELVISVDQDRFRPGEAAAADALWAICSAQTSSTVAAGDTLEAIGEGRYRVVLTPAVGHHEQKKLVGCLEDLTIDRVRGNVESFRTLAVAVG
jgi:hypothetical protein